MSFLSTPQSSFAIVQMTFEIFLILLLSTFAEDFGPLHTLTHFVLSLTTRPMLANLKSKGEGLCIGTHIIVIDQ